MYTTLFEKQTLRIGLIWNLLSIPAEALNSAAGIPGPFPVFKEPLKTRGDSGNALKASPKHIACNLETCPGTSYWLLSWNQRRKTPKICSRAKVHFLNPLPSPQEDFVGTRPQTPSFTEMGWGGENDNGKHTGGDKNAPTPDGLGDSSPSSGSGMIREYGLEVSLTPPSPLVGLSFELWVPSWVTAAS